MDIDKTTRWLTLVANFGVIGGIVFLAIEIGQNQASLEQSNRIDLLAARATEVQQYNDFRSVLVQDQELTEIWAKGRAGDSLDSSETERFVLLCKSWLWMSVTTYERSIVLGRVETADGAARLMGQRLIDWPGFRRSCWDNEKATVHGYGLSEYVEAVEAAAGTP